MPEKKFEGSRFVEVNPNVMLGCISQDARQLLDLDKGEIMINELAKHNYIGQEKIAPSYVPARIKADWKMPISPVGEICPDCGAKIQPIAHNTDDGWFLGWECSSGECNPLLFEDGFPPDIWPFVENYANWRDLANLGFRIV